MYKVIDISKYIINYCNDNKYVITNKRLNYYLYFIQCEFVDKKGKLCFYDENIHCWICGPVVPSIHRRYKTFGSTNIPREKELFWNDDIKGFDYKNIIFDIKSEDKNLINILIEICKDFSISVLEYMVFHQEPFIKNFDSRKDNIIPLEDLYSYFHLT